MAPGKAYSAYYPAAKMYPQLHIICKQAYTPAFLSTLFIALSY